MAETDVEAYHDLDHGSRADKPKRRTAIGVPWLAWVFLTAAVNERPIWIQFADARVRRQRKRSVELCQVHGVFGHGSAIRYVPDRQGDDGKRRYRGLSGCSGAGRPGPFDVFADQQLGNHTRSLWRDPEVGCAMNSRKLHS
jgi:hypothetical protein